MILIVVAMSSIVVFAVLYIYFSHTSPMTRKDRIVIVALSMLALTLDFLVEFNGTRVNSWNYPPETTVFPFMLFNEVPLELPLLFAGFGAIIGLLACHNSRRIKISPENRHVKRKSVFFFFLTILGIILYFTRFLRPNALVIAIPAFLLGISLVSLEKKTIVIGISVFFLDLSIEVYVVIAGYYSYDRIGFLVPTLAGFPLHIPFEYALFTMGGIMIFSYLMAWYDTWGGHENDWYKLFFKKKIEKPRNLVLKEKN